MMTEHVERAIDFLKARVTVLEAENTAIKAYLTSLNPAWNMNVTVTAPTGAAGSMTTHEEPAIIGYVTPRTTWANIRKFPTVAQDDVNPIVSTIHQTFPVYRVVQSEDGYNWYELPLGGFVRHDAIAFSKDKPAPINAALWPAPVSTYWVTSHHGEHGHKGIDFGAPFGESIINPVDGFVLKAFECVKCKPEGDGAWTINNDDYGDGYGTYAILRHLDASLPSSAQAHIKRYVFILYGHMSELDVVEGFPIRADSRIGRVGSTGNSTGSNLHLEVRTSDNPNISFYDAALIDPELIFSL